MHLDRGTPPKSEQDKRKQIQIKPRVGLLASPGCEAHGVAQEGREGGRDPRKASAPPAERSALHSQQAGSGISPKQGRLGSLQGQGCSPAMRSCKGTEGSSCWGLCGGCWSLPRKHLLAVLLRQIIIKMLEVKATSLRKINLRGAWV